MEPTLDDLINEYENKAYETSPEQAQEVEERNNELAELVVGLVSFGFQLADKRCEVDEIKAENAKEAMQPAIEKYGVGAGIGGEIPLKTEVLAGWHLGAFVFSCFKQLAELRKADGEKRKHKVRQQARSVFGSQRSRQEPGINQRSDSGGVEGDPLGYEQGSQGEPV